jgi:hypothetical protein
MSNPVASSLFGLPDPPEPPPGPAGDLLRLEALVVDVLNAAALYDIGSYGWLNENDADPELIGHAMWQVDQPLSRTLMDPFGEQPVHERPSERDKQVLVAGEDFCGMMRLARLSIGMALLWREHRPGRVFDDGSYFWLQHTDAVLKLAIASDRLRDVLIVACTGDTVAKYKESAKKRRWYATPFKEVRELLEARGAVKAGADEAIAELPHLAVQIYSNIERRNETVHEIATRMGHIRREQVDALQARYEREQKRKAARPPGALFEFQPMPEIRDLREAEKEHYAELDAAVKAIADWYKLLVKASSYVFEIEYWSRVKP